MIFRFENEWSLLENVSRTKKIKMSSLTSQQRALLSTEILQLGEPVSKTETTNNDNHHRDVVVCSEKRQRRKTKAPQSRSSAISWHPDFLCLVTSEQMRWYTIEEKLLIRNKNYDFFWQKCVDNLCNQNILNIILRSHNPSNILPHSDTYNVARQNQISH